MSMSISFIPNKIYRLFFDGPKSVASFDSPVRITTDASSVSFQRIFEPQHVFEEETVLLHYECLNLDLKLVFIPMTGTQDSACLELKNSSRKIVAYALPELGPRANYAQVAALPQFKTLASTLNEAARTSRPERTMLSVPTVMTITALVFICTVLFFSSSVPPVVTSKTSSYNVPEHEHEHTNLVVANTANTANTKTAERIDEPKITSSLDPELNEVEKKILAQTVAASGIELSSGGKPFVIFSDPNCPSCRQLELKLETIDKSLSPVIVPVSFQRNSPEAVASILCSADVSGAWKKAVRGESFTAPVCEKGPIQAEANNVAFSALKFNRTPTIVTASGKVAVGFKDFDGLMKWIKANS